LLVIKGKRRNDITPDKSQRKESREKRKTQPRGISVCLWKKQVRRFSNQEEKQGEGETIRGGIHSNRNRSSIGMGPKRKAGGEIALAEKEDEGI